MLSPCTDIWTHSQQKGGLTAHRPAFQESVHAQSKIFLWLSSLPLLALPSNGIMPSCRPRTPPRFPHLWFSAPQPLANHSLASLGCLHTTNPSPLPGTELQSLSLSAKPLPRYLRLWCCERWYWWSVWLSFYFVLLSPDAAIFTEAFRSLHLGWSPHQLGGFPGYGFLSFFTAPFQGCWYCPDSFSISFISLSST